MKGSCVCGGVTVETAQPPDYVNFCDCTLCRKVGAAWAYFIPDQVTVTGPTADYVRADFAKPAVIIHFCATCGATTHWTASEHYPPIKMGVNVRLFEESELAGVEARFPDGRGWDKQSPPGERCAPLRFGERPLP